MATYSLTVNGVERAVSIVAHTLDIFQTLDGPGSMEGDFLSADGSLEVENDQSVVLMLDATVLFSGYVMSWRLRGADGPAVDATITRITALDNRGLLKRRVVTETIAVGSTLKQALQQLIPYAPELTLESGQADGPTSTEDIVFTKTRLNEAISRVVTEIGAGDFTWRVNNNSELRAFELGEIPAPFDFVEGDATECGDLEVEDKRDDNFANRVFVDGGIVTQYGREESFVADGVQDEFPLLYTPFATRGYIVHNGIFETLGTSPAEWELDTTTNVLRKVNPPVPTNGVTVSITFDGTLHILGEADGRGSPPATEWAVYESVSDLSTIDQANEVAAAILAQKMASAKIARYPTRILGLQVGQTQSLTSPKRHIVTSDWLIRQVQTIYDGGSFGHGLLHTPEFSASGVVKGTFQQTYREWAEVGGASASVTSPSGSSSTPALQPEDLQFRKVATVTEATLMPAALVLFTEPFTSDTGQFTKFTENTAASFAFSGGQGVFTNSSGALRSDIFVEGADLVYPQLAAQLDVVSRTGTLGAHSVVGVGIAKDANNWVMAAFNDVDNNVYIGVKIGGSFAGHSAVVLDLTAPYTLGFSIVGQTACAWVDTGSGFEFATGYAIPTGTINFKTTSLTGWKPALGVFTSNNQVWTVDNFKAGRFGSFGIRDQKIVTYEDGTPYITGGSVYLTATCCDGLGNGCQGVFMMDMTTYALTQVASIFIDRGSAKHNDLNAHIIYYANGDRRITITSWGNGFGGDLDVYHKLFTGTDILSGSHLLSGLTAFTLPTQVTSAYGAYDQFLVKDGSTWRLAHTITTDTTFPSDPFYTAIAESSDLSSWTESGNDRSRTGYEGTQMLRVGGTFYCAAGGHSEIRWYDKACNFRGVMKATVDGGTVTFPHPALFYNGSGKYVLVTFNQNKPAGITAAFTWGQMVVHEATA